MAHLLLGTPLMTDPDLLSLLRSWGMTAGLLPVRTDGAAPSVWDCDAVLADPDSAAALAPSAEADQAAPVVVLGEGRFPAPILAVIEDTGPEGGVLLSALQTCLAQSAVERGELGSLKVAETDPLRVLGHELRTPLTAIKTALEVMAGEPGAGGAADPNRRMIELAQRNVRRLQETIEWSQTLLAQAAAPTQLKPLTVSELGAVLKDLGPVECDPDASGMPVWTDPDQFSDLAYQAVQAFRSARPQSPVRLRLAAGMADPETVVLQICGTDGAVPFPEPGAAQSTQDTEEGSGSDPALGQLVRLKLSCSRLGALGATYCLGQHPEAGPVLEITLPGAGCVLPS